MQAVTDRIRMYADEFQQHLSAKLMGYEYSEGRKLSEEQLVAARELYTYGLSKVLEQIKADTVEASYALASDHAQEIGVGIAFDVIFEGVPNDDD